MWITKTELEVQNRQLKDALRYLLALRKRNEPTLVQINYTDRGKVRDILDKPLWNEVGL